MGHVQHAYDPLLQRNVAIKMLVLDRKPTAEHIQRMQREAKALGRLKHRNVVQILDFDITDDGQPFLVMDLIDGPDLDKVLMKDGPIRASEAIEIGLQICYGLKHAHENSLLHRDLKPANVLLQTADDGERTVKIIDLGLAKFETTDQKLTKPGTPLGSPEYMSPEQAKGEPADERSDIYSFGCVLFKMLTGSPPFEAKSAIETLHQQVSLPPPTLSAVAMKEFDPALEKVVSKCLAKDPKERFKSVGELEKELKVLRDAQLPEEEKHHNNESTAYDPVPSIEPTKARPASHISIVAVVAVVLGLSALVIYLSLNPRDETVEPAASSLSAKTDDPFESVRKSEFEQRLGLAGNVFEYRQMPGGFWRCKVGLINIKLTDEDLKTAALRQPPFEELDISDREVNGSGLKYLAAQPIKAINIEHTELDDEGAKNFAIFKQLGRLDVACCDRLTDVGMQTIASTNPNLNHLEFGSQTTTLRTFEIISSLSKLQYILVQLPDKPIPKGFGKPLAKLNNLTKISFRNCHFLRGSDLGELLWVPKLDKVGLWAARISKDKVAALNKLPITDLTIASTNLFEPGALLELKPRERFQLKLSGTDAPKEEVEFLRKKYPRWTILQHSGLVDPTAELN